MTEPRHSSLANPAAPLRSLGAGEAHVWYAWTAPCASPALLAAYRSLLNPAERQRLERFAFDYLKLEYLVTRALCRTTLSRYASIAPVDWSFVCNQYGRPEIATSVAPTGLRFNLSNARSLVACIVTLDTDAGVDVEEVDRRGETVAIADRFFSPSEVRSLRGLPEAAQRRRFFEFWTLKESYIKARGMGLSIPLEKFSFEIDQQQIRVGFDHDLDDVADDWQFELHAPSANHLLAIGIRRQTLPPFRVTLHEVQPWEMTYRDAVCAC